MGDAHLIASPDDYLLEDRLRETLETVSAGLDGVEPEILSEDTTPEGLAVELCSPSLFAPHRILVAPDIEAYFSFVLGMFLAFGVTFEVPIVVVLVARFGIASVAKLKQARPYVIVGAFILAAIFTPPDVLSQLLLAIPLCLLYELGIFCARFVERPPQADEKAAA